MYYFFFQAEDGIRDTSVTGVQTCALPIADGAEKFADARYFADGAHHATRGDEGRAILRDARHNDSVRAPGLQSGDGGRRPGDPGRQRGEAHRPEDSAAVQR